MDGAVHTTTAQQGYVGGIDDGIHFLMDNITLHQSYFRSHRSFDAPSMLVN